MEAPKVMNREIRFAVINPPNLNKSDGWRPNGYRRRTKPNEDCDGSDILCCCTILHCCEPRLFGTGDDQG